MVVSAPRENTVTTNMKNILYLSLSVVLLLSSCNLQEPFAQIASSSASEVRYKDPTTALRERRSKPVEIAMAPEWNLTEKQLVTATRKPQVKEGSNPTRYLYPEDLQPTEEETANGSALTAAQRTAMKKARQSAAEAAGWQAFEAAERYNKEHAAEFAPQEKQGKHIVINLNTQRGVLKDGETELLAFKVCSGSKSRPTPKGHFHVLEKDLNHHSNLYNNSAMPYFMRLTMDGLGLHQGPMVGYPASHGCIRLSEKTARSLYNQCDIGLPVFVQ